jgi:hypothetical protein
VERKKALACAVAITSVLGSTTLAFASVGGGSLLGFGRAADAGIGSVTTTSVDARGAGGAVSRTRNVYDEVVVGDPTSTSTPSAALAAVRVGAQPSPTSPASTPNVVPPETARDREPTAHGSGTTGRTANHTPTTREPKEPLHDESPSSTTSTTNPPVTTTTRPRGVPADWPPDKPIPPMPANCGHPQLEDNGVWNCEDD